MDNKDEKELEVNRKNREDFENLMEESSINKDGYWDKNNPVVRFVLILIGVAVLAGSAYYITMYFLNH